ncbi:MULTISPECIES: SRPBCC family protein [Pseudonocardia]|uniref:Polyketide cyclase / dehydrase and lipid transport n=2 Tax=Pseudonocardia TaxID=1847 RepID=A0A1Y2MM61_PSEAH|nr:MULTISPECIES: SRPBCC family protein [Pseudonocardia]OSY36354.1 Polyketide cyclase / dehydrase and lipid transport [Pseudonocardia autotrophica]TDN72690.1 polyketide cyclase/dehydrase/lipid transport protein [Pseudonocardia autotrophica]BBG03401.1 polyketide cyclase [Pseudonocardia autotrophica]GEC27244.1 polyketide cyclase [Pseudonocardia saturnea]
MVGFQRVMTVSTPAGAVLGYLADLGHSEDWNPGTKSCTRSDAGGPICVGSTWHAVAVYNGRETELAYTLIGRSDSRLEFVGENSTVTATVDVVAEPVEPAQDGGSVVTYRADLRLKGLLKLAAPFLRREFERLGDEIERNLPPALEKL